MAKKKLPSTYQKYTILIVGILGLFIMSFLIYTFVKDINSPILLRIQIIKHALFFIG